LNPSRRVEEHRPVETGAPVHEVVPGTAHEILERGWGVGPGDGAIIASSAVERVHSSESLDEVRIGSTPKAVVTGTTPSGWKR
jgi:hypothetical protein